MPIALGPDSWEIWLGMLQEFVLSRTVRDTALMLDMVSRPGQVFVDNFEHRKLRTWNRGTLLNCQNK